MRTIISVYLAVIMLDVLTAGNAMAGWNYLTWGMTKEAAIAASKGEVRSVKVGEDIACAFIGQKPFAIIPRKRSVSFNFP